MQLGYVRASKNEQNFDLQIEALKKAGCEQIFKGGAGIFTAIGRNLNVTAHWQDDLTIIIGADKNYEVISKKFNQIQIFATYLVS